MTKLSEHFHSAEFSCPCCGKSKVTGELVNKLQSLRDLVGEPIIVTSGYRCPQYNLTVGGSVNSAHLTGEGADIQVKGMPLYFLANMASKNIEGIRIGIYPNHLHIDVRPPMPSKYWIVKNGKYIYSKHEKDLSKFLKKNL